MYPYALCMEYESQLWPIKKAFKIQRNGGLTAMMTSGSVMAHGK